ncbi:methylated-DNA--[protein]-cysteine S-methyltransferase [Bacillus swezeyi]|uniref:methylated-DNA--[protein]-cysteine S-methyltransferase n=1 Tax=Bacillus swezeyi TaxID=1925020 RepID=UPI003F8925BD
MSEQIIYWGLHECGPWNLYLAATSQGLCYTGSDHFEELAAWAQKRCPSHIVIRDDKKLEPYADELTAYLRGRRKYFSLPVDLYGTPFQLSVLHALRGIPYGRTSSYTEIAERIQRRRAVRAVGAAIGANPVLIVIPCHRVIGKNGKLTGYRGGLEMKQHLLRLEGSGIGECGA